MNTTVPDKRNAPTLGSPGIPWAHLPLHWSSSDPLIQKTVLGAKLFTYIHVASLRAGTKRYLERSEVGYLRFLTARTKKRASRCGTQLVRSSLDSSRSLTKKLSLFVATFYWVHWNKMRCESFFRYHYRKTSPTGWVQIIVISKTVFQR
jgi:hypothetical protein